jgi:3-oxoacyl-[acyl-carrier protein] reductase
VDFGLTGRRAAVAGASAGLGLATAEALAAEGADVAICGRNAERLHAVANERGFHAIEADVSNTDGAAAFITGARDALGGIDILVANAGGPPGGGFRDFRDPQQYADAFTLNALSTITMCLEAVPEMRAQSWGRIVAVTSIAARQASPHLILSATARAGVTGFLKTLAIDVAADGITVNSLQPGLHETDRLRQLYGGDASAAAATIPAGQLGRPEDFGRVAAFLCSDAARFITGSALLVDGGAYLGLQ